MDHFFKYQALGNDFVLLEKAPRDPSAAAIFLCDRNFGVGSDGLIVLTNQKMDFYNPDGTIDQCGNGIRCAALHLFRKNEFASISIETLAGEIQVDSLGGNTFRSHHRYVSLPEEVTLEIGEELLAAVGRFKAYIVDVGTPHLVIEIEDKDRFANLDLPHWGGLLENHQQFATPVSIDFYSKDSEKFRIRIWERGVGETLGCGTGALSVAKVIEKQTEISPVEVESKGGVVLVEQNNEASESSRIATLQGHAHLVFTGEVSNLFFDT